MQATGVLRLLDLGMGNGGEESIGSGGTCMGGAATVTFPLWQKSQMFPFLRIASAQKILVLGCLEVLILVRSRALLMTIPETKIFCKLFPCTGGPIRAVDIGLQPTSAGWLIRPS